MKSDLLKIKSDLIKSVNENTDNIINTLELLNSEIVSGIETKKNLLETIDNLAKKRNNLIEDNKKESLLNSRLNEILKSIEIKEKELRELNSKQSDLISNFEKKNLEYENEISKLTKNIEEKRKTIFPTISELNERERMVKIKEEDIEIIIDRYKKLYAKIGKTFVI